MSAQVRVSNKLGASVLVDELEGAALAQAREWLLDCGLLDDDDVAEASATRITRWVHYHFDGGLPEFLRTVDPAHDAPVSLDGSAPKHTSGPWTASDYDIFGPAGEIIANMAGKRGMPDAHNAAFIVRACNAHEALVAALDAAYKPLARKWGGTTEGEPVLAKVRAALGLAKGERP